MRRQLVTGLITTVVLTLVLGVAYPLVVWGVGRVAFGHQTDGSLVRVNGAVVGSALIGQNFTDKAGQPLAQYFQPRPSAAGNGYDPTSSGGSQLGPSSDKLLSAVAQRVKDYRSFNGLATAGARTGQAVTASGSGLDPDISVANALDQAGRVATARHLAPIFVIALVHQHTNGRAWGILGEKTVNVLDLNIALDRLPASG